MSAAAAGDGGCSYDTLLSMNDTWNDAIGEVGWRPAGLLLIGLFYIPRVTLLFATLPGWGLPYVIFGGIASACSIPGVPIGLWTACLAFLAPRSLTAIVLLSMTNDHSIIAAALSICFLVREVQEFMSASRLCSADRKIRGNARYDLLVGPCISNGCVAMSFVVVTWLFPVSVVRWFLYGWVLVLLCQLIDTTRGAFKRLRAGPRQPHKD